MPRDAGTGTSNFAHYVAIDAEGFRPADSWFHLLPGDDQNVELIREPGATELDSIPRVVVRALNSRQSATATGPE